MVCLFENLNQEEADILYLVLRSQGIFCRIKRKDNWFCIEGPEIHREAARDAVDAYLAENSMPSDEDAADTSFSADSFNLSGIWVSLMLLAVYVAVSRSGDPGSYSAVFGAASGLILSGEGYRCVTAMLLHADAAHLMGNMAGLVVFGGAVSGMTGTGAGWLLILGCGILGNWVNAMVHPPEHLSIGASTAVFGALGLLAAIRSMAAIRTGKGWRQVGVYLGAGAALLGLMGTSARSDIGAHLFGCLVGFGTGIGYAWLVRHPLGHRTQIFSGGLAVLVLVISWMTGADSSG
ncbi:rhomboid family intramembrane serine protease [Desulfosarcina sp. OttesenSCG-928-A07]|nr:rhomboid family intramembrane serine protease [Desulfosarcina sp. OttesenSCG-928-G17]MDL2329659.1 rhomboid family intramembrane serine protease [Desulfosarcina sp. OttesenSCG-928-A07]